jgi:2-polyprenyl-6-methoxyphenol hydroxylase-like FAD-dependent oxidoreductase
MDFYEENKETEFLIIGAGPAGLIAGIHLAKLGIKAQIVDQHKQQIRPLCGEYLSPEGVNYIKRMGLDDCLDGFNHLLGMTIFSAGGIKVCTSFPENSYGLSLNREIFQTRLSKKFESLGGIIHGVQLHVVHGLAY